MPEFYYQGYYIQVKLLMRNLDAVQMPDKVYDKQIVLADDDFCSLVEITVAHGSQARTMLVIAPYHTPDDHFAFLHESGILLVLNELLCIFDPVTLSIRQIEEIDPCGTMIAAYPYGSDYIIHGEVEIYRVSADLKHLWSFSGHDIFIRCDGVESGFVMQEDRICLWDFMGNYYEIDYDGKLLLEIPSK